MGERSRYYYETGGDGYCEYATKAAAIRNAAKAGALHVRTTAAHDYGRDGRIVWRNPTGGDVRGELCDTGGTALPDIFQTPLD